MTATLAPPEPDTTLDYPDTLLIGDHPANAHDTGPTPGKWTRRGLSMLLGSV